MEVGEARMALVGAWRLLSSADRSAVEEPWVFTLSSWTRNPSATPGGRYVLMLGDGLTARRVLERIG
jgi:hypothetical protein